jgi:hypothetical protein
MSGSEPSTAPEGDKHIDDVARTMAAMRAALAAQGISVSSQELIAAARLAMALRWGWPRRERASPSD